MERDGRAVRDRLADRILVQVALWIVPTEDLESPLPMRGSVNGRTGEADVGGVGQRRHQVVAEITPRASVRLVHEDEDVVPLDQVIVDLVELVDHGDDQPTPVALEKPP